MFELVYVGIGEARICKNPHRYDSEYVCEGVLCGWFKGEGKKNLRFDCM
jgi:hypothetical protein